MKFKNSSENYYIQPEKLSDFIDANFNRENGIYTYLTKTEYKVKIDNNTIYIPNKIVLNSGYQRFRRSEKNTHSINYKGKKIVMIIKTTIIPFGNYERKFRYSGKLSEIINDTINFQETKENYFFSNDLIPEKMDNLYEIDSKIQYPSYLLFSRKNSDKDILHNSTLSSKLSEETLDFIKDSLSLIGINYDLKEIDEVSNFIIFPVPYLRILQNKLDTASENEKVSLIIEKNPLFHNLFNNNIFKIQYNIKELNSDIVDDQVITIPFSNKAIQNIEIQAKRINKIGLCKLNFFLNDVLINKTYGSYIRGIKINTKIKSL